MKLIIMCGLPGSGKSSRATFISQEESARIVESDVVRDLYFNGKQDKETHVKVFEKVHEEVLKTLSEGFSVICDATNLNYKHRMSLINKAKKYNPHIVCDLSMTQYEICIERDKYRERSVGERVIKHMRESFWFPQTFEGIDEINISSTFNVQNYNLHDLYGSMRGFEQDNPNHSSTLLGHTYKVCNPAILDSDILMNAGFYHDIGKLWTKSFKNSKGETTDIAHYYNHESVSAYEAFFYLKNLGIYSNEEIVRTCGLINYHMRPYSCKTEKSDKKLKELVGENFYYNLMRLNKADKEGK